MEKEKQDKILEEGLEQVKDYVNLRIRLAKMEVAEKTATVSAFVIALLLMTILGFFCVLFLSVMAGFYFSEVFHSPFYGFGIIAAFYLVSFSLVFIFRRSLVEKPVVNRIIKELFDKNGTNENS